MRKVLLCVCLMGLMGGSAQAQAVLKKHSAIDGYYKQNEIRFLWLAENGKPRDSTIVLLETLQAAWTHGLNPKEYHLEDIQNYLASDQNIAPRFFDQMISDAYVAYVRDMSTMRVEADMIEQDARYWRRPMDVQEILNHAAASDNLQDFLTGLVPQGPLYARLQEELITLSQHHDADDRAPLALATGVKFLRPGDNNPEFVPLLRAFLNMSSEDWQRNIYEDALVNAVVAFQRENGLKADGVIGPNTLRLMNKTPREKIYQIIANMERLRWLQPNKPSKYILVNIPAATLWAIDEEKVAYEMPVIVGRKDRPTKSFVSEITGVRFNPTWTVPYTIKKEDYIPMLRKDPQALIKKGIDISYQSDDGYWMSIDPTAVDWESVDENEMGKYRMVQAPGPTNPLGTVRVLMPNQYNIYLHDTSSPEYFRASDRSASSGCVRMKYPVQIAEFILRPNDHWSRRSAEILLAKPKTTDIIAQEKIPVYLLYLTIWLNEDNTLTFGPDIYDWDRVMVSELQRRDMIPAALFAGEKTKRMALASEY